MKRLMLAGLFLGALGLLVSAQAQEFPRGETIYIEDPGGLPTNPDCFNLWIGCGGGYSNGLQQLTADTLWYIDPNAGINGEVVHNALAAGPGEWNADFTELTVHLTEGLYWSHGQNGPVEFTAHDVVYTVEAQMEWGMGAGPVFAQNVASVAAIGDHTVKFWLKAPNSRFDTKFMVRWNAPGYIMPKHVFEDLEEPSTWDGNLATHPTIDGVGPVSIGQYVLHSYDPNGTWFAWVRRDDWERSSWGMDYGMAAPKYQVYRPGVPIDKRAIGLLNNEGNQGLDMVHDMTPEATIDLMKKDPLIQSWQPGFPYAHPDPTLPMLLFNHQYEDADGNAKWIDRRVRWALALALDAVEMSLASYRGAATMTPIHVPPTGMYPKFYHDAVQDWLTNFELDLGDGTSIKPYNPDLTIEIANRVRGLYDGVPEDDETIRYTFGHGWWAQNHDAAATLLEAAGWSKSGKWWNTPNGERATLEMQGADSGVMGRLASNVAEQLTEFGIETEVDTSDLWGGIGAGNYEAYIGWSVETWGGHPDLSFFLDSWRSDNVAEPGTGQSPRNWMRWNGGPELDAIIDKIRGISFNDPRGVEYGIEFIKLAVREMPTIPIMSYNLFVGQSNRCWTGYPDATNNYANPVTNWSNARYIYTQITSTGACD